MHNPEILLKRICLNQDKHVRIMSTITRFILLIVLIILVHDKVLIKHLNSERSILFFI